MYFQWAACHNKNKEREKEPYFNDISLWYLLRCVKYHSIPYTYQF